ncbi:hypothetical protein [Acinetobacter ursingii]|uniref:hypothetical protein n=1 Tax=Acinetobacter ursingii TaxID=108980 RepID=UPI0021CD716E|nr:hypothetical protein [Acinetobacter ursingii]MCU4483536.1 hypothetical protein [Acinetobacter ursingii]MCU4507856.1 hypothetical protein [Acinetobacter ursingii]
MTNLTDQQLEDNREFLIGDAVVLNHRILNFDEIYNITEVYENTVDVYIGIGILTLSKGLVHHATVAELNAKRRLTYAEMALGEVS